MSDSKFVLVNSGDDYDAPDELPGASLSFIELLGGVRRRWWLPVILATLAGGYAWRRSANEVATYTAEVLIQRRAERTAFDVTQPELAAAAQSQLVAAQFEILRSRAVLGPVVDAMNIRVRVNGVPAGGHPWITDIQLDGTRAGRKVTKATVSLTEKSATVRDASGERVLARVADTHTMVELPGLRFRIASFPSQPVDATIDVLTPEEAIRLLRSRLELEAGQGAGGLIRLRYTSTSPEFAAQVANAISQSYQVQTGRQARETASGHREFLEKQFAQWADSLAVAQQLLSQQQEGSGMLDPKAEGAALTNALVEAEKTRNRLVFEEGLLRTVITALQSKQGTDAVRRVVSFSSELMPAGADLYSRLRQYEMERSALTASRFGLTENNQRVEVLDSMISSTRSEIRAMAEQSLSVQTERRREAEAQVARLRTEVGQVPAQVSELSRLQQRAEGIQRTFDLVANKYYEAQINEAMNPGLVSIIDPAVVPMEPDPPGRTATIPLALLVGLAIGVAIAMGLESLDATVRHSVDAQRITGVNVIGMIPRMPTLGNSDRPPLFSDEPGSGADAFRAVRTALRFMRAEFPKVIAVTSPGPGEGKTIISSNLAVALAQQENWRVLLIDADLRRPQVHAVFQLPRTPGLSDVLVGAADRSAAIHLEVERGVDVLTCGTNTQAPAELLGSQAFKTMIEQCRERYDAVVIDTPPVLIASESAALTKLLDGILVTARVKRTNRFALRQSIEQLKQVNASILGLVLNDVPRTRAYGRYSAYSGYYGYKYYDPKYMENGKADVPSKTNRIRRIFSS